MTAHRSNKRTAGAPAEPTEPATASYEKSPPGGEQTHLKWESSGRRRQTTMQAGGMKPAPQCAHAAWRTYESGSKWWMRCEAEGCKGRLAEGPIQDQEGQKRLVGWIPYGWKGEKTPTKITNLATGEWECNLCQTRLPYGSAKVLTDVGMICMPCRTGTYEKRKLTVTRSDPTSEAGSSTASAAPPPEQEGMTLNAEQVEMLQEVLTAKQWRQLLELA